MDNGRRYTKEDYYRKEQEDILAFGYSCKLFRDDEKAADIDCGIHLIPCMADPTLMIDRFDVRGALTDLKEAESKENEKLTLTEGEELEEKACEYESFCDYPVYNNYNAEEHIYREEEHRRLQMELAADSYAYNQVGLTYNEENYNTANAEEQQTDSTIQIAEGEIFVPTPDLNVPNGMEIPTIKQHKIILKTARFVANHGPQMEIVLMTKQSSNPSFNFMSFDNILNPYYKHIISQIKSGKLRFTNENYADKETNENNCQLNIPHVDLTPGTAISTTKASTVHCTYSNLISKIREKQKASGVEESEIYSPSMPSSPVTYATVPSAPVKEKAAPITPASTLPIVGLVDYPSFNQAASDSSEEEDYSYNSKMNSIGVEISKVYDYNTMVWPSPELQMVIDKLACYIVKNGPAFKELVKNRRDPRFDFLNNGNEFNPYFQCKLQLYGEVYGDTFNNQQKSSKIPSTCGAKGSGIQRTKYSAKGRAISFSIKSKDVEAPLSSHTTFPVESSTSNEDMDDEEKENRKLAREQKRLERKQKEYKIRKERETLLVKERSIKEQNSSKVEGAVSDNDDLYDIFKYAQNIAKERLDTNESQQKTQSKQLERKMKAAAFLGKLKTDSITTNGRPPIYGPHLPVLEKSRQVEEPDSSNTSSPSGISIDRLYDVNYVSPVPSVSGDSAGNWPTKLASNSPKQQIDKMSPMLSPFIVHIQEENIACSGPLVPKEEWSHSRHKKSRKRSTSRSPENHRDRKKKKKSHSSHKRKRHHSRSRSRDRSKSHRSSHKKRKHVSHKEKSKAKRKKHRKYRSPSLSSLSSESSKTTSFPSDSDSEVQVISSPNIMKPAGSSSRSSSVMSISDVKLLTVVQSGRDSSGTETNSQKTSSTTNNIVSKPQIALCPAVEDETNSSVSDPQENDKKSSFDLSKSSAMAKITEGLRAKLYAMLEKGQNT